MLKINISYFKFCLEYMYIIFSSHNSISVILSSPWPLDKTGIVGIQKHPLY